MKILKQFKKYLVFFLILFLIKSTNQFVLGAVLETEAAPIPSLQEMSHPRLLVTAEDLPKIRERLKTEEHKEVYDRVKASAFSNTSCILPARETNLSNKNNEALAYIEANAFLYLMESDFDYAKHAIDGILNYLQTFDAEPNSQEITREWGLAMFTAAEVYDWCYPQLSTEQKQIIRDKCLTYSENMEFGYPPEPVTPQVPGHTSEAMIIKDLFGLSIAVYDEDSAPYNLIADHIFNKYIPAFNYFYEDGYHSQGEGYGIYRHTFELYLKWILEKIGQGDQLSANQEYLTYQFLYTRRPDGAFMSDGDDSHQTSNSYERAYPVAFLSGNLYRNPYFRQEAFRCNVKGYQSASTLSSYGISDVQFLLLNDPTIGLKAIEELPLSHWFGKHSGVMLARTDWTEGENSNAMVVTMKTPERFYRGHQHLDSGEFEIFYKTPLALDSGTYSSSFGSDHDYAYHKLTVAHNCMLINQSSEKSLYSNKFPNAGGQYPPANLSGNIHTLEDVKGWASDFGTVLGYDYGEDRYSPSYTYLKGDLTKAYNGKTNLYTRTFLFQNFFDSVHPGALIVFDRVESDQAQQEYKKSWLLHSQNEPVIQEKRIILTNGEGKLINDTLLPENPSFEKIGGEGHQYEAAGINYPLRDTEESGNWRTEISYPASQETEYFLNVIQVSDNNDDIQPLESQQYDIDTHVGIQIFNRVAYISKSEARTNQMIQVTGCGTQELQFQVDGLQEGTWEISGNDTSFQRQVSANGGMLSFWVMPGTYTLTYMNENFEEKDFSLEQNLHPLQKEKVYTYVGSKKGVFETLTIEKKNNVLYAPADEFAAFCGGTFREDETGAYLQNGEYYLKFQEGTHSVVRKSLYGSSANLYTESPPFRQDGKLYVSVKDCAKVLQMETHAKPFENMLALNPSINPSDTLKTYRKISVTCGEGGKIIGETQKLMEGQLTNLEIVPDQGYIISEILWNNEIVPNVKNDGFVLQKNITEDATLQVTFEESYIVPVLTSYSEAFTSQTTQYINQKKIDPPMAIVFARAEQKTADYELMDWGILLSKDKELLENPVNGWSVENLELLSQNRYSGKNKISDLGNFGICLFGTIELKTKYYAKPYAVYQKIDGSETIVKVGEIVSFELEKNFTP